MIRGFSQTDLKQVSRLEFENFRNPWATQQFQSYCIGSSDSMSYVYKKSGKVIGYLMTQIIGDEIHLHNISVSQRYQNNKIGFNLMSHLISEGRLRDKRKISLEVNENNIFALKLYYSLGFIKVGVREKYYANNESAILMDYKF